MSARVLFLSPYPRSVASHRVRIEQYVPYLESRGVHCEVQSLFDESTYRSGGLAAGLALARGALVRIGVAIRAGQWEAVLVHREAVPLGTAVIEQLLGRIARRLLFDFDDAIYLPQPYSRRGLAWLRSPAKFDTIVAAADRVLAGNPHLAERAQFKAPVNTGVHVVPSVVDTDRVVPSTRAGSRDVVIGWMGSPSTAHYLEALAPVLREALEVHPRARLEVVGAALPADFGPRATSRPWSLERELDDLRGFDIGLMPLPDNEWARGKCGYKALQYMSAGVATISSPVGVATEIADHGEAGLLASDDCQWRDALALLLADPSRRKELAEAGRERAVARYSLGVWAPVLYRHLLE